MALKPIDRWANEGPEFNRPVAEAVYGTLMKMDADEAVMFSRILLDAVLEDDLMVHGEMIAKALDDQARGRAEVLKKNLAHTAVAKGRRGESADTELAALHELSKSFIGDLFSHDKRADRARKQQRGVGTGQFVRQTNDILHTGDVHSEAHEKKLGIPAAGRTAGEEGKPSTDSYTKEQRAAYQQAYHQVSELVKPYQRLPSGTAFLHLTDNKGETKIHAVPAGDSAKLDAAYFDPAGGRKIVQTKISVLPPADEKGAVFSAFDALGMPNVGATLAGATKGGALDGERLNRFTNDVRHKDRNDEFVPSQKVFRRLNATAGLLDNTLGNVAPPHAKMAIKVAQHMGSLGPATQNLIGPTADRAAYRYRGTERTIDPRLELAVEDDTRVAGRKATAASHASRMVRESEARRDAHLNRNAQVYAQHAHRIRGEWEQASRDREAGLLSRGDHRKAARNSQNELKRLQSGRVANDTAAHKAHNQTVKDAQAAVIAGKQEHRKLAVRVMTHGFEGDDKRWKQSSVLGYMKSRVASPELHELQLEAGTVPPSEGIILDDKGKVVSQAVGYGDDHYLPFTLKGMRKMRGGSYVRTRTWGGPTAEDIRTALIGGAHRLTVVSNSGVFSLDFAEDFTGGRRHNDKAHRMIGRYEHLLDAVRNGKVSRAPIDSSRLADLEREAAQRFNPKFNKTGYDAALKDLKEQEQKNPSLSSAQLDAASTAFLRSTASEMTSAGAGATVDDLLTEITHREAARKHQAAMVEYQKENNAEWRVEARKTPENRAAGNTFAVASPPSLEAFRYAEKQPYLEMGPQELARTLATRLNRVRELDNGIKEASEVNRDNVRAMQLNGPGYDAALKALQEQFPYYIDRVKYERYTNTPQRLDTGYVRPGSTRPNAVRVGMHDSQNSAGKVRADSVRGQTASRHDTAAAVASQAAAQTAAAPSSGLTVTAAAPAEDSAVAQRRADRATLDYLLKLQAFGPDAEIVDPGTNTAKKAGGYSIRSTVRVNPDAAPAELRHVYETEDEDSLYEQLDTNPAEMHRKLEATVRFLDRAKAWPADGSHEPIVASFKARGATAAASDVKASDSVLRRPNGEYSWANNAGEAYRPGNELPATEIANAYLRDELAGHHVEHKALPPTLSDVSFENMARQLAINLDNENKRLTQWKTGPRTQDPPVDEATHDAKVAGLVHARTLRRRYDAAVTNEINANAERQRDLEMAAASAPVEQIHRTNVADFSGWGDEAKERLLDEPELRASTARALDAMAQDEDDEEMQRAREMMARATRNQGAG